MRKRCRRRVWSTEINAVAHAIAGACVTDTNSLNQLRVGEVKALEAMKTGEAGVQEWQVLVDMMNIAEMMGRNGIGPEVLDHCEAANEALHRAAKRYEATKRMGLSGEGLRALGDIMEYHDLQRTSVSRAKYQQMIEKTRNYLKSHGKYVTHIE
jgi:flavin-binding protein dodecin